MYRRLSLQHQLVSERRNSFRYEAFYHIAFEDIQNSGKYCKPSVDHKERIQVLCVILMMIHTKVKMNS